VQRHRFHARRDEDALARAMAGMQLQLASAHVQVQVRGRELQLHAGHRARKGILVTPRVKPVALHKPAPTLVA
jgi:hypothetical protein